MMNDAATFEYESVVSEQWWCGACDGLVKSGLRIEGLKGSPSDETAIGTYICDACLLKLFNAVPLLSWPMRETISRIAAWCPASAG